MKLNIYIYPLMYQLYKNLNHSHNKKNLIIAKEFHFFSNDKWILIDSCYLINQKIMIKLVKDRNRVYWNRLETSILHKAPLEDSNIATWSDSRRDRP